MTAGNNSGWAGISADHGAGAVVIGESVNDCDVNMKGALRWNSASGLHQVCDGVSWKQPLVKSMVGNLSPPTPGTGYFVLSAGEWDGNLGGVSGAHAKCFDDLTNNDWLNKGDAVSRGILIASNVRAFVCFNSGAASCASPVANTVYTFASSGSPLIGGATFVSDADQLGPGNTQEWVATNYFGVDADYWTNRGVGSGSLWAVDGRVSSSGACSGFTSSSGDGYIGSSNSSGTVRWSSLHAKCSVPYRLICMVHP